jgi:large subunit ribosomal protein L31e
MTLRYIHIHSYALMNSGFKKRAPKAVKVLKSFAEKTMGTKDVRLDPKLNKAIWTQGVRNVPHRIRVRLSRRRNDQEDAKEKLYTLVSHVPVVTFKGADSNQQLTLYVHMC